MITFSNAHFLFKSLAELGVRGDFRCSILIACLAPAAANGQNELPDFDESCRNALPIMLSLLTAILAVLSF